MVRGSSFIRSIAQTSRRFFTAACVVALLVVGVAHPRPAAATTFGPGDVLEVDTPALNLRAGAGTAKGVIDILPGGAQVTIVAGPVAADGYTWYEIASPSGWLIGEGLAPVGSDHPGGDPVPGEYAPGTTLVVTTDALNLRTGFSLQSAILDVLPYGVEAVVVSGGPWLRESYLWYRITAAGQTGFAVSDFLAPAGAGGELPPGDAAVVATDALNVRTNVGLGATVVAILPWGTPVTVLAGPIETDGYTWYRIASSVANGWAAGQFLTFDDTGAPGGLTPGGTAVVSDGPVNLRQSAGIGGAIITTLPTGTPLGITDGPAVVDSYTWYRVTTPTSGSGWVASEFIAAT